MMNTAKKTKKTNTCPIHNKKKLFLREPFLYKYSTYYTDRRSIDSP